MLSYRSQSGTYWGHCFEILLAVRCIWRVCAPCRETGSGDSGVVSSHKVVETTVHTVKTVGGTVSESKTTTVEELKTVEGIITSCMETTSSTSTSAPAEKVAGIENV